MHRAIKQLRMEVHAYTVERILCTV